MGIVYIYREAGKNRFTVGAAKNLAARVKGGMTRYNPHLKLYRLIKTTAHFALENFIHNELADKRDNTINSKSWYDVTPDEIDCVINKAETIGRQFIEYKRKVSDIKNTMSDGRYLPATEHLFSVYNELSRIDAQLVKLKQQQVLLQCEAKNFIGTADGVDGLFEWPSHEVARFQVKIFAEMHPELYEQFLKTSYVRKFKLWTNDASDVIEAQED